MRPPLWQRDWPDWQSGSIELDGKPIHKHKPSTIAKEGTTILLVEQNANAALKHSHRAYVLETGAIVMEGPSETVAADPRVKEAYLGE